MPDAQPPEPLAAKPPHDSAATKRRLLLAATNEFAERGIAGARVDRIAADASPRPLRQRKSCGSSKAWPSAGLPQPARSWRIQRPAPCTILTRIVKWWWRVFEGS